MDADVAASIRDLARQQSGVVARRQLRELGVPRRVVRAELRGKRWQRPYPGTFVVFTGPVPPLTRVWAALAYAGRHAVASHETAAWLDQLRDDLPPTVEVCVPHGRRHRASRPGVRVRQSRHLDARRHPARTPPRTRVEDTVLDLTDARRGPDMVIDVVLAACQRRLTTAARLRDAAGRRKRMRWRALVADLLAEVVAGVQSALERRYRRDVERSHGLPRGRRNRVEGERGRRRYRDVRYRRFRLLVELDGRAAHPDQWKERDDVRDNEVTEVEEARTLRYGWHAVAANPCETAAQVARVARSGGWAGRRRACGPDCTAVPVTGTSDAA
jgi:hypothetical protein